MPTNQTTTGSLLTALCPELRTALTRVGYDADTLLSALGPDAHAALGRSEPVPVRRSARAAGELGTLIRLLLLGDALPEREVAAALAPVDVDRAVAAGLLERHGDEVRAALDLRPLDAGEGNRWILSDLDDSMRRRTLTEDHVLGVGHASLSLLRATPTRPVGSVLDLGTGCGVQAVHAASYARTVTATDVNPRALWLAEATAALNGLDIELLEGSWFEPVAGRRFDQVVANPPFVVGPARIEHTYRDSGLALDGASRLVVSRAPDLLAPGGTAAMLAAWVHVDGEDWRQRVSSWLPAHGVDAWVVQRDVADPALYVGTWLRDAGLDPRDPASQARAEQWLDAFAAADVEGIGFGFVYLRAIDGPTELLAEDLTHGFDDPLGAEASAYFERSAWLRAAASDENHAWTARFAVEPTTALERVSLPGPDGWAERVARLHRGDGPRWQHEVDETTISLVAGMRPDGLPLYELVELLALAHGAEEVTPEFAADALTVVAGLVRHGLIAPV
ncbi:Methyltransferase small domain-containing protein [Nocardia amikacinitolerans]|uniref:Methyltransferase small domain-containing protein n=1 Tax=Nocardia amikacinitolerans TaxID=756689 RepID=A0A285LX05_9NOCA|nr:methyltransferase [Nocardia amikacinitolerans]MCP2298050.1 Methyltransferase small domain-containing protein [Nocardia amikacinitolerans]SNY89405.1 Methyltransferase small domain-containing protein [Nocardia amikacinitolerans]